MLKLKTKNYFFNFSSLKLIVFISVFLILFSLSRVTAVEIINFPVEKIEEDLYHVEAEIPMLLDLNQKNIQQRYNNLFRDSIFSFFENTIEMAIKSRHDFKESGMPFREFLGRVDFEIKNNNQILSIKFNYYQYTGGAHGSPYSLSYNIDLATGEDIKLIDFLENNNLSLLEVESIIKSEIEKDQNSYFQGDLAFKNLAEDQCYYLETGELVIYFQPYVVAPYSTGMPEFRIKY